MTKISVDEDCGNAPKKQFIKDFNIAFASGDMSFVLDCLAEDIEWKVINRTPVVGKEAVAEMLKTMGEVAQELVIENIVSHGARCVANGELIYQHGKIAFCDVYTFSSHSKDAKIKSIVGYAIDTE